MDDEHLALKVNLVHLGPPEVLRPSARRERADAGKVDAQVELRAPVVLDRVRIDAVRLQAARDPNKLVHHAGRVLAGLALLVQLQHLLLQRFRLAQGDLQ